MKELVKPGIAILIAVLVTLIIGLHAGFPQDPDAFQQRAERLHQSAIAGGNIDDELVSEKALSSSTAATEQYGFIGDSIRVMKWYAVLVAAIYFAALILVKAQVKETILVSFAAALIFLYLFGISSSLLLAVAAVLYIFLRVMFRAKIAKASKDEL